MQRLFAGLSLTGITKREHRHSGIELTTPEPEHVHYGITQKIAAFHLKSLVLRFKNIQND